jgi:hypothetical protein
MGGMIHSYAFNEAYGDYGANDRNPSPMGCGFFLCTVWSSKFKRYKKYIAGQYITRVKPSGILNTRRKRALAAASAFSIDRRYRTA